MSEGGCCGILFYFSFSVCFWGKQINNFLIFSSDGETFISADDLRINLWNLEISNQSFNIVDVKPANMEDLTGKLWAYQFTVLYSRFLLVSAVNSSELWTACLCSYLSMWPLLSLLLFCSF